MTDSDADVTSTVVEHLPIEVSVELGRLQLTGAQVMDLELGDVLTLDRPVAGAVDLRVGGKLMARGELVDVDGEAGIRLLEVFESASQRR